MELTARPLINAGFALTLAAAGVIAALYAVVYRGRR